MMPILRAAAQIPTRFFNGVLLPRSLNEDRARKEFILNILLATTIGLFSFAFLLNLSETFFGESNPTSIIFVVLPLIFLVALLVLSRKGFSTTSSMLLLGILFLFVMSMSYRWGIDVPSVILLHTLTIVMAGVLIGSRFAFVVTIIIFVSMLALGLLQQFGITEVDHYWRQEEWENIDTVVAGMIFLIIATVSWLSNREIERSLKRARKSEAELKEERDLLEVRVEERTKELRKAEMEKINQSYRFIEFGRLASGLFHDLANPLTALSLNIQSIASSSGDEKGGEISTLGEDVNRAQRATEHIQKLMESLRKHLSREGRHEQFSLNRSVEEVVQILMPYARQRGVSLKVDAPSEIKTYGDDVSFTQVMTNLISNAIDSYAGIEDVKNKSVNQKEVRIILSEKDGHIKIQVCDFGKGISKDMLEKIFEPFITTKNTGKGLGLGLSLAKRIAEKGFGGTLTVESIVDTGSTFTVQFESREP